MFKKKNIYLYCLIFTVITICLSIFNFVNGSAYDSLGYYHELYRAIALFIFMSFIYAIRHFNFNKLVDSLLSFWPLLLGLLLLIYFIYKEGNLSSDVLKKWLLILLFSIIGIILLFALISTLSKYLKDSVKGKSKLYFSMYGCLMTVLSGLPLILWKIFNGNSTLYRMFNTSYYLFSLIPLSLLVLSVLLSRKTKNVFTTLIYIILAVYYILWTIAYYSPFNIYLIQFIQIALLIAFVIYVLDNKMYTSLIYLIAFYICIFIGTLNFFA